jgi:hypothetical protein
MKAINAITSWLAGIPLIFFSGRCGSRHIFHYMRCGYLPGSAIQQAEALRGSYNDGKYDGGPAISTPPNRHTETGRIIRYHSCGKTSLLAPHDDAGFAVIIRNLLDFPQKTKSPLDALTSGLY